MIGSSAILNAIGEGSGLDVIYTMPKINKVIKFQEFSIVPFCGRKYNVSYIYGLIPERYYYFNNYALYFRNGIKHKKVDGNYYEFVSEAYYNTNGDRLILDNLFITGNRVSLEFSDTSCLINKVEIKGSVFDKETIYKYVLGVAEYIGEKEKKLKKYDSVDLHKIGGKYNYYLSYLDKHVYNIVPRSDNVIQVKFYFSDLVYKCGFPYEKVFVYFYICEGKPVMAITYSAETGLIIAFCDIISKKAHIYKYNYNDLFWIDVVKKNGEDYICINYKFNCYIYKPFSSWEKIDLKELSIYMLWADNDNFEYFTIDFKSSDYYYKVIDYVRSLIPKHIELLDNETFSGFLTITEDVLNNYEIKTNNSKISDGYKIIYKYYSEKDFIFPDK